MSDDLTPAEQARAARWAKGWLLKCEFVESETAQDAMRALGYHADRMDPPETVESLRAERDNALTNARTWEDLADGWRDRAIELRGDVREANAEMARLRSTHTEAEAAWERCKRQPRVWHTGDPEPEKVQRVRDRDGDEWVSYDRRWCCTAGAGSKRSWRGILNDNGPLTEVLHDD